MLSRQNPPTLFRSFSAATLAALLLVGAPAQAQNCPTGDNTDDQYILGEVDGQASAMHWPTGLVWKRCSEGQTFESGECTGTPQEKRWNTWTEMDRLLPTSFANQTSWGIGAGFSQNLLESGGWRMAYRNELWKITEICGNSPKVNRTVFPNTPSWYVWSGSPYAGDSSGAWRVYFGNGNAHYGDRSYSYPVRLVRGGQSFDSLVAPAAQDAAPRNTATFPAFTLSASLPAGQAWGGARITGDGSPAFQINGTGGWVREAIVKSGDQITVRLTTPGTVGASRTATFTLRSGQTTGTSADAANGGSEATALQETSASFTVNTVLPVVGVCGTADGVATVAAPSVSLCSAGTASAVDGSAADAFIWSCLGQHGGADSGQCSAPRQYAVTPSAGANGTISPDTVQNVTYNQPASFTVIPATGYSASVGGACPAGSWSGDVYTTGQIAEACTVEASFTEIPPPPPPPPPPVVTYTVTATASPAIGGNVVCSPSSVSAGEGSICTATDNPGYRFIYWGGDCSGTDPVCTLSGVAGDRSVTANFTEYTGTCTGDNAGANYITGEVGGEAVAMHWTSGLVWKRCREGQNWNVAAQTCEGTVETRRWNEWMDEYMPRSFEGQDTWWAPIASPSYTPAPAAGPVGVDRLRDGQWRMAYQLELAGLTTACEDGPKINREVFPMPPSSLVWSGSPYAGGSYSAWGVYFGNGSANYGYYRSNGYHVRLVRGGQSFAALSSPVTGTGTAGSTVSFPPFALASESGDGVAWGGLRIAGEGDPQFQVNGGAWVTQAVIRSGDEITVRVQAGAQGSEHEAVLTLRSGQTTPTSANGTNGGSEATVVSEASARFRVEAPAAPPAEHAIATSVSAGSGTVSCTPNPVPDGGSATCTATPAAGFNFASWGGACSGSGVCTLSNVTSAQSVSASFTAVPPLTYDVTATASPAVGGNVVCTPSSVSAGESSICTATAHAGYSFADWGGDCSGTDPVCTLSGITAARSVTANFTADTGTCTGDNASANYIVGEAAGQAVAMHWTSGLVWKRCSEGQSWNAAVQTCEGTTETRRWNEWLDEYMPRSFEGQDAWWGTVGAPPYTPDPAAGPVGVDRLRDGQWRMAYRLELAGLTTGCENGPKINREVFPATPPSVWSGSPYAYDSRVAWYVSFYSGNASGLNRSFGGPRVRLVRGGQSFDSLTSPSALTVSAGDSVSFPAFTLAPSVPAGEAWGGARISGDGNPEFQLNGTGDWVQQAIVKSGDQIAVRFNAPDSGSRTVTFTLRSGQTTGTSDNASNAGSETTALQETSASFTANVPAAGVCGTADGVATVVAPSVSLCSAGTASAVEGSAADAFTWRCLGQHGGADSGQCSAPRQYAVTPSAGANGTISPDTLQNVTYSQTTSFTVTPATGYSASVGGTCPVGGWSGSTWTTGAIIEACTVEASFTEIPPPPPPPPVITYTVAAASSPAAGGTTACTPSSVSSGETSTCTATANAGYRFTGWSGDCTGTETSCTLTDITADRSVTASFASRAELDLPLPEGTQSGQTLRVVATGGEWYFDEAHTRTHTGASVGEALPAGVTLPHGVVSLRLIGGTPGSSATVVLTYPEALPAGTRYYKYGPTAANPVAHWYEYPHAVINGHTITLTLTDGGAGDSDLSENGVIVDPGGPAQVAGDVAPDVTPIPTLSQWATMLLAGLIGLLAFGRLRRLPHA